MSAAARAVIKKRLNAKYIHMFWKKNSADQISKDLKAAYPRLWRYCLVLTANRDHADDLEQMTSLRVLEKHHQYQPDTHFDRWIFRIAQRTWINELRKNAIRQGAGLAPIDEIELPDNKPNPEMNFFAREVLLEVLSLPEAQRSTVLLAYVEGYSYKEVAEVLEIPIGTVMSRLSAARAKLMAKLDDKESNPR